MVADAAFGSESELFDFDTAAFYVRWMDQIRDAQVPATLSALGGLNKSLGKGRMELLPTGAGKI